MNARRTGRGFTLIELLVVLLLVGLLVSFAVLSVGGRSPEQVQREEARRVLARMDLAREEAVMRARSLGVRFADDAYRFFERAEGQWQPLGEGGLLAPRELPGAVSVAVEIDGLDIALGGGEPDTDAARDDGAGGNEAGGGQGAEEADDDEDGEAVRPQIFFLAGGEIVPAFTIRILSADTDTEFRIAPGDEEWLALSEQRF